MALLPFLAALACGESGVPGLFRIGVVVGADGVRGAQLALAEAQGNGELAGRRVELTIIPHALATAAAPSIEAADSLASDPAIIAVVGHSNSAASLAASQVYNARRLPHIAPTTTSPLFSSAGPYSFRLVADDRRQAEFLVRQAATARDARVAIVSVNDDYGRPLAAMVREGLARHDAQLVHESRYLEGADSASVHSIAESVVRASPDVVIWLGRAPELRRFLAITRSRLPELSVIGSDGVDAGEVYDQPGRFAGVRFARFVDPASPDTGLRHFRERFRARYRGADPSSEAVLAYDAVKLLLAALRSGASSREAVRDYLAAVGHGRPAHRGISGPIVFDPNGDVDRQPQLGEVAGDGVRATSAH